MILADDDIDPDEISAAEQAYLRVTGSSLKPGELQAEAEKALASGTTVDGCLGCVVHDLDASAQRQVLESAFAVASADGFVLEEEDALLLKVGQAIGMQTSEVRATLNELMR